MVCNAAQSQKVKTPVASTAAGELTSIVATNLVGAGCGVCVCLCL